MENKICKNCGSPDLVKNRKICVACNRLRSLKYYPNRVDKRKQNIHKCNICDSDYIKWRETQVICPSCYKLSKNTGYKNNQYKKVGCRDEHRVIAENLLERKLNYNEVVHHVDENPTNNNLENLWIMSRHNHAKLHEFLRIQRVAYEKSLGKDSVNCWNIFRVNQTTAWLETTNAKVKKLIELDNQKPSTLKGEGSETKHGTSEQVELKMKI